jgi:hypothetical protein
LSAHLICYLGFHFRRTLCSSAAAQFANTYGQALTNSMVDGSNGCSLDATGREYAKENLQSPAYDNVHYVPVQAA